MPRDGRAGRRGSSTPAARERSHNSLLALRALIERISLTPSPKTIVFISEGLVIDRDFDDLTWLGPQASRGQVVLHVLQLDEPYLDASEGKMSPTRGEDLALSEDGLNLMAGLARGSVLRVVAQCRLRVQPAWPRAVGLLPPQLRAGSRRSRRQDRTRSRSSCRKRSGIEIGRARSSASSRRRDAGHETVLGRRHSRAAARDRHSA